MRERRSFSGIGDNPHEDHGVQESMGPIYDRTKEHLGATDTGIVRVRQMLLDSVQAVARGQAPIGLDDSIPYNQIRSYLRVLPHELPWHAVDTYPTEDLVPDYLDTVVG
jgi:phthalate 4,5-dioxygenase